MADAGGPNAGGGTKPVPHDHRVADRMRRRFIGVAPGESLDHVLGVMHLARVRALPVVDGEALLGLVSYRAIARAAILAALGGESPRRFLELQPAAAILEPAAAATSPEEPIRHAAARLARAPDGLLPVLDPRGDPPRLLGLLTESDLLRELAGRAGRAPASGSQERPPIAGA